MPIDNPITSRATMNISRLMVKITHRALLLCEKHAELFRTSFIAASIVMFAINLSTYFGADPKIDPSKLDKVLATLLLVLPILQIAVLLCLRSSLLRGVLAAIMLFSLISYHPAWWLYSTGHYRSNYWAIFTLAAAVLVVLSLWVTWLMMRAPLEAAEGDQAEESLEAFRKEISQHSFQIVCFFLSLFLSVTFAMGFAFALHDKYERTKEGWALCVTPPPGVTATADGHQAAKNGAMSGAMPPPLLMRFEPGKAEVQAKEVSEANQDDKGDIMMAKNNDSIDKINQRINAESTEEGRLRIILAGHTDSSDLASSKRYKSNYELSDARARCVYLYLTKRFGLKNVAEWTVIPLADENSFWGANLKKPEDRRSVEVWIEANGTSSIKLGKPEVSCSRNASLNDYMYFTLYTITTTGHGDIRPVCSETKFMTSICSLFEVFFLIIFFNVLIASRQQQPVDQELAAEIGRFRNLLARLNLLFDDKKGGEN
ncbi:MAG: ion channel [Thermoanaerobaculia bacterium]